MHEVCFVVTFMKLPAVAETLESCYLEWMIIPVVEVFSQRRLGSKALLPFLPHQEKKSLFEPVMGSWQPVPADSLSSEKKPLLQNEDNIFHCMKFS